jgi:hypothetical protein
MDQSAHQLVNGVLQDFDNHGLGSATPVRANDAGCDPIAVHGLEHLARRHKYIVTTRIGGDKAKAVAMTDQAARELWSAGLGVLVPSRRSASGGFTVRWLGGSIAT